MGRCVGCRGRRARRCCAVCLPRRLGWSGSGSTTTSLSLGGDSIVSIQLVSRARRAGLLLTPRAVFQHQTVAGLAEVAEAAAALPVVADIASGPLPATPIMRWLRERGGPIDRFNQSLLLRVPGGLREAELAAALQAMLDHHDGLRLRLGGGLVVAGAAARGGGGGQLPAADRGGRPRGAALRAVLEQAAESAADGLSPGAGRMLQAVWLDGGAERAGRLLLVLHHLVVDGVSWRILVPDLMTAWQAVAAGRAATLAACGTSLRGWAQRLLSHATEAAVVAELPFWRQQLSGPALRLHDGELDGVRDTAGTAGHLTLRLDGSITQALLTRVPARFYGGIHEVLLSGLAVAVADWCARRGRAGPAVLLDVEGHGREEVFRVARSVADGWLVHQPLSGSAGGRGCRCGGGGIGRPRGWGGAEAAQGAVAGIAAQGTWLWAAALSERCDGGRAGGVWVAAAGVQLPGPVCGWRAGGLVCGERGRGAIGCRCGAAAFAWRCAQRADLGRRSGPAAGCELDVGAGAVPRHGCCRACGGLVWRAEGVGGACR